MGSGTGKDSFGKRQQQYRFIPRQYMLPTFECKYIVRYILSCSSELCLKGTSRNFKIAYCTYLDSSLQQFNEINRIIHYLSSSSLRSSGSTLVHCSSGLSSSSEKSSSSSSEDARFGEEEPEAWRELTLKMNFLP